MVDKKQDLIDEIKHLISVDGSEIDINPHYLEYFEIEELQDIRDELLNKKIHQDKISNDYLDELYVKCGS